MWTIESCCLQSDESVRPSEGGSSHSFSLSVCLMSWQANDLPGSRSRTLQDDLMVLKALESQSAKFNFDLWLAANFNPSKAIQPP